MDTIVYFVSNGVSNGCVMRLVCRCSVCVLVTSHFQPPPLDSIALCNVKREPSA